MRIRGRIAVGIMCVMALFILSCTTDTAWRRATVSTYELLGEGLSGAKDTTIVLYQQNVISTGKLEKAKVLFNKAQSIYVLMGKSLKLAGRAQDAITRDKYIEEYEGLLAEFSKLSVEIYDLVKGL